MSYFYAIIETFQPHGEFSHNSIRARPVEGQGLSTNMRVECSTAMRQKYPVGTKIKIRAQLKHTGSDRWLSAELLLVTHLTLAQTTRP